MHYVAELKIDGLSIAITYEDGRFARGVTRGDGVIGEDVSSNVRTIQPIPLRLKKAPDGRLEVRGEIYLPRAAFDRLNDEREAEGAPLFANPAQRRGRHAAQPRSRRWSPGAGCARSSITRSARTLGNRESGAGNRAMRRHRPTGCRRRTRR